MSGKLPSRFYSLRTWKDIATITAVVIAAATFVKAVAEYTNQGTQQRVEHFLELRKALKSDIRFREILALVDAMPDTPPGEGKRKLKDIEFADKRDLLGLFEEVAVMTNSGLISKELSHYFFGYYAIRCNDNEDFWHGTNKDSYYWAVFKHYVEDMRAIGDSPNFKRIGDKKYYPVSRYRL